MCVFVTDGIASDPAGALVFYNQMLEMLEWGRQVWRNASKDDHGVIFEDTFLWGVGKCLRLELHEGMHTTES